jgi:hypothetical protein
MSSYDEMKDDLRPEYDLSKLRLKATGPGRRPVQQVTIQLAPDVAARFPTSEAVNEALRFLIWVTENNPVSAVSEAEQPEAVSNQS